MCLGEMDNLPEMIRVPIFVHGFSISKDSIKYPIDAISPYS